MDESVEKAKTTPVNKHVKIKPPNWEDTLISETGEIEFDYAVEDVKLASGMLMMDLKKDYITKSGDRSRTSGIMSGVLFKEGLVAYSDTCQRHGDLIKAEGKPDRDVSGYFRITKWETSGKETFGIKVFSLSETDSRNIVEFLKSSGLPPKAQLEVYILGDLFEPKTFEPVRFSGLLTYYH